MQRGYIKIWRKLEDSGLLQMHSTLALFMVMLMKASYKPCRVGMVDIDRGQLTAGRHQLATWAGMSEQNVRTCLKNLHSLKILTSKSTNKFTVYTFVNYGLYQDYDDTTNQQTNQQSTNNQPTVNQQLTTIKEANTLSIKEKPLNPRSSKGTRLQTDFELNPEWGNAALEIRNDWNNQDVLEEFNGFKDYWISLPGQKAVKLDWLATWRNWCRRSNRKGI